jgi:hypothetical protein
MELRATTALRRTEAAGDTAGPADGANPPRLLGLLRVGDSVVTDVEAGPLSAVAELSDARVPAPVSANATAGAPIIAALRPRVTAPAPSQAYGWMRRCFDTDRLPRVVSSYLKIT